MPSFATMVPNQTMPSLFFSIFDHVTFDASTGRPEKILKSGTMALAVSPKAYSPFLYESRLLSSP